MSPINNSIPIEQFAQLSLNTSAVQQLPFDIVGIISSYLTDSNEDRALSNHVVELLTPSTPELQTRQKLVQQKKDRPTTVLFRYLDEIIENKNSNPQPLQVDIQILNSVHNVPGLTDYFKKATRWQIDTLVSFLMHYCHNLCSLDFSDSQVTNFALSLLDPFRRLHTLTLSGCNSITDQGVGSLQHIPWLENCDLSRTNIDGSTLHLLPKGLKVLKLNGCRQSSAEGLKSLKTLTELKECYLDHVVTMRDLLDYLPQKLEVLQMDSCGLSDLHIEKLQHLPLRIFSIVGSDLKGTSLNLLSLNLQVLNLSCCANVQDQALLLLARFKQLHTLSLFKCTSVTDQGIAGLQYLPGLTNCDLSEMNFQGSTLHLLPKGLQVLKLNECPRLSSVEGLKSLQTLTELRECYLDRALAMKELLSYLPLKLEVLQMDWCGLSDLHIENLQLLSLRKLSIAGAVLKGTSLNLLFPRLQRLDLSCCDHLPVKTIAKLRKRCSVIWAVRFNKTILSVGIDREEGASLKVQARRLTTQPIGNGRFELTDSEIQRHRREKSLEDVSKD